jgi:hypothetical protein
MLTYEELWGKACKTYGQFIPPTTFRDWITQFCLLSVRDVYESSEAFWVIELAKIARRHPKGSPKIKKTLHAKMEADLNGAKSGTDRSIK